MNQGQSVDPAAEGARSCSRIFRDVFQGEPGAISVCRNASGRWQDDHHDRARERRHRYPVDVLRHVAAGASYGGFTGCPGDLVTTSGSGLDPHIALENAEYQLDRVSGKWAQDLKRDPAQVRQEIDQIVHEHAFAPMHGLFGEQIINVLEVNFGA